MMSNLYHYSYKYIKSNLYHYSYKYIKSNLYHYSYKYIKSNLYHYSYKYIKSCSQYNSIYMNETFCPNWNLFENVLLLNASIKFVFPQYIYICIPSIHLYLYSLNTSIFVFPQYIYMFRFVVEMLDFINCYDISRSSSPVHLQVV